MMVFHRHSFIEWIRHRIEEHPNRMVPFKQFMDWALYHPTFGYYMRSTDKVGKSGDFYTSPHVGAVFGETIGHFMQTLAHTFRNDQWSIVEFGGGDGKLAADVLQGLTASSQHLRAYHIIEASPYHRTKGIRRLGENNRVKWVSDVQQMTIETPVIVIANEFVDAMPVHRLRFSGGSWKEVFVSWNDQESRFEERLDLLSTAELCQYVSEEQPPEIEGYTIEVNLAARTWLEQLATVMDEGYVIVIDYGDDKHYLWHPHRYNGTLACYYQHRAHNNPYIYVGEQDITAHVNFSSLERWGTDYGFNVVSRTTQGQFLIEAGITDRLTDHTDPSPFSLVAKRNRAIRQLISPEGMGSLFKVLLMKI